MANVGECVQLENAEFSPCHHAFLKIGELPRTVGWRREWDSNPRYSFPHTRFPSVRLKPLGHLSEGPSLEGA
jgi:hypothetical protein